MKRTPHRLLRRTLASAAAAAAVCGLLTALPQGTGLDARPVASSDTTTTVFYYTKTKNWAAYNLHYAPDGGTWTTVPGVAMEAACTDWVKKTVPLSGAEGIQATFNNGSGVWDNNGGKNYDLGSGSITVKDGVVAHSDPCADSGDPDPSPTPTEEAHTASVYYSTATVGWTTTNLHYQPMRRLLDRRTRRRHGARLHRLGEEDGRPRLRHLDEGRVQQRQRRLGQQQRQRLHHPHAASAR